MLRRCAARCGGSGGAGALFLQQQRADYEPALWGGAAAEYERSYGRKMERYAAAALRLAPTASLGDVLDVGCGAGAVWDALCAEGDLSCTSFTGVDYAAAMIDRAARKVEASAPPRLAPPPRLMVMDGQHLQFDDAAFDTTVAMFSVLFFADKTRGMAEMARVTRAGGRGLLATWSKVQDMEWVFYGGQALVHVLGGRVPKVKSDTGAKLSFQAFTEPEELKAAMTRAGWAAAAVTPVPLEFDFAGRGELEQLYLDMSHAYPTLRWVFDTFPDGERAAVREEVAAAFAALVHAKTASRRGAYGTLRGVANIAHATK